MDKNNPSIDEQIEQLELENKAKIKKLRKKFQEEKNKLETKEAKAMRRLLIKHDIKSLEALEAHFNSDDYDDETEALKRILHQYEIDDEKSLNTFCADSVKYDRLFNGVASKLSDAKLPAKDWKSIQDSLNKVIDFYVKNH